MSKNTAVIAAFMMEGLHEAGYDNVIKAGSEMSCGAIEIVSAMVEYAVFIDNILVVLDDIEYPGVFDYEVSSPFGKWFGQHIIVHKEFPSVKKVRTWLAVEIIAFFKQGGDATRVTRLMEAVHV